MTLFLYLHDQLLVSADQPLLESRKLILGGRVYLATLIYNRLINPFYLYPHAVVLRCVCQIYRQFSSLKPTI